MAFDVERPFAPDATRFKASSRFYDLLAYERWLFDTASPSSPSSYLFLEPRLRFFPEPDDVIVLIAGVRLERRGKLAVLQHPESGTRLPLEGLELSVVERILGSLDGARSLIAAQVFAEVTAPQLDAFLRHTFGRLTLCPNTVVAFDSQLGGHSIVRTPGSPYEIDRGYWSNMIDVRRYFVDHCKHALDEVELSTHLCEMHVLSLMGQSGRSYYRPNSPILGKSGARAGSFYETATRTRRELGLSLLIDGPRVSAPFVGGHRYHELLCGSLDDAHALDSDRELFDPDILNLSWGGVTRGMARSDHEPALWYLFPRPIATSHLTCLARAHGEALGGPSRGRSDWLGQVARFHWYFVRLHPFACANQSLSMNLCNAYLEMYDTAPIPHLILDQLALRLSLPAYERLFSRAVSAWSIDAGSPLERMRELARRRAQLQRFLDRLTTAPTRDAAERVQAEDPEGAWVSLVRDEAP